MRQFDRVEIRCGRPKGHDKLGSMLHHAILQHSTHGPTATSELGEMKDANEREKKDEAPNASHPVPRPVAIAKDESVRRLAKLPVLVRMTCGGDEEGVEEAKEKQPSPETKVLAHCSLRCARAPALIRWSLAERHGPVWMTDRVAFFIYPDATALCSAFSAHDAREQGRETARVFVQDSLTRLWRDMMESVVDPLTRDYMWHDEEIKWRIVNAPKTVFSSFLHGTVQFGDGLEDEWLVVRILLAATRAFPQLVATVFDTDGDFLLIEAAEALPPWLEPESSKNRVFLHQGRVHIVPLDVCPASPTLEEALHLVRTAPHKTLASSQIQQIVSLRSANPQCLHHARMRVPVKIAQILNASPRLASSALNAFYLRDPDAMRACVQMRHFNPGKTGGQLVTTTVALTRMQFAQLACQDFVAPANDGVCFLMETAESSVAAELGMKLTCGFEMLMASSPRHTSSRIDSVAEASVQEQIEAIMAVDIARPEDVICSRLEDSLAWMEVDEMELEGRLRQTMDKLAMDEDEQEQLVDEWTHEFATGGRKQDKPPVLDANLAEIDSIVSKMTSLLARASTYEGIDDADSGGDDDGAVDDDGDIDDSSDSSSDGDSEADERLLEREIFETINYDPDLFMKIIEANAHMGVDSAEFIQRFRQFQADGTAAGLGDTVVSRRKGLADIDPDKLAEAKRSNRPAPADEDDGESADADATAELSTSDDEVIEGREDCEAFIYGQTLEQFKRSHDYQDSVLEEDSSSEPESVAHDSRSEFDYDDYVEAMDCELQDSLKTSEFPSSRLPGFLSEAEIKANLGANLMESSVAGRGAASVGPTETVVSSLGHRLPRQ